MPRPKQEAKVSKLMSLVVKAFALVFVLTLDKQNAINFQLLGGIWILQTFPAVVFSLFTRWFHRWALLAGWAVSMVYGTVEAYQVVNPVTGSHFGGSLALMPGIEKMGYIAMTAFALNLAITIVLSAILNATKVSNGQDETIPFDYFADADDPRVVKDLKEHGSHTQPYGDPDDVPGNARAALALRRTRRPGPHREGGGPVGSCLSAGSGSSAPRTCRCSGWSPSRPRCRAAGRRGPCSGPSTRRPTS